MIDSTKSLLGNVEIIDKYLSEMNISDRFSFLSLRFSAAGHTGARTLDRSVISTVLYPLPTELYDRLIIKASSTRNIHPFIRTRTQHTHASAPPRASVPPRTAQQPALPAFNSSAAYRQSSAAPRSGILTVDNDRSTLLRIQKMVSSWQHSIHRT